MKNISLYLVFIEGMASFLSPCLLPLLPVYIGYLSGEATIGRQDKRALIINSLFFSLGLTLVFIAMGATASALGQLLNEYRYVLMKIAAVAIIVFGLFHMGILKIGFLYKEKRINAVFKKSSILNSLLFGAAFAFGWTPCIGPILSSVLFIAGTSESAAFGGYLLTIYSMGLSIPFIITAALMEYMVKKLKLIQRYSSIINTVSGIILIFLGIALYTGWLNKLTQF
ncbi:thiol:disulfide interchange protein DsbD [Oxobacter pfennigii]|uniref:Thiol:disulfide interchange protein DsbD n=1 Tax=Oxobacter pfennigii TaxID=36849 RepID=A0A0N8NSV2_9CLOT|nr:cytochrome c biogenesis protein CcdA [Oxobacter pfennigii]KPU43064.1 thiol:disulfide interchange protein DsbD [Oxobacter pfennigii]